MENWENGKNFWRWRENDSGTTLIYPIQQHSSSSLSTEIALFQLFSASTGIHFNIVYFPRSSFFT
nr:MAG TPA: hypothetical protein [Bacteriophage sp.]